MSEISPVDLSILDLLASSREAAEQAASEEAIRFHEIARTEEIGLTVGGMLTKECHSLRTALRKREEFYLDDANWLQRRNIDRKKALSALPIEIRVTKGEPFNPQSKKRVTQLVRRHNLKKLQNFSTGSLFPQEAELTTEGPIVQDWRILTRGLLTFTEYRVHNPEQRQTRRTLLHTILTSVDNTAIVSQNGRRLEEHELFFPLGLVIEGNRQVRATVPRRVSKKW